MTAQEQVYFYKQTDRGDAFIEYHCPACDAERTLSITTATNGARVRCVLCQRVYVIRLRLVTILEERNAE